MRLSAIFCSPFRPAFQYIVSDSLWSRAIENETDNSPYQSDHIWVPRRLVYTQAILLGLSALTFFLLGVMVGNLTSSNTTSGLLTKEFAQGWEIDCRVSGVVSLRSNDRDLPNVGSVVILIPKDAQPEKRQSPGLIMPDSFVALDNPVISAISEAGGTVVRTDAEGKFNVLVDLRRQFHLLVLCKGLPSRARTLTPKQRSFLESWFAPADKLLRDNDFLWSEVDSSSETIDLGVLQFE